MASTYSQNLALELMATGDQPGEWGNTTNRNLGTLLEQAISGYVVQVVSDVSDTVITIPNGQSGVARNMYIELTGTLTGNRNLVVPNNNKLYFIYNNTTGGYAVTVKTSTGVGTAVPAANKVILLCNGSDVVPAINAGGGGGGGTSTFVEEVFTATADQTVFNLSRSYVVGSNTLAVYVDGVNQIVDMSYTETDSDTITFSQGLHEGALVKCVIGQAISTSLISLSQSFVASQDQTVFTLTSFTYQPNTNNLSVFVNGSKQILGVSYSETSTSSITFNTGLNAGDRVELISGEPINLGSVSAENVRYLPAGTGAELTTVQAKLRETVSVKDFGAVGDGVTDDTAAFVAALAAANFVFVPAGTYVIGTQIDITGNKTISGQRTNANGYQSATINFTASSGSLFSATSDEFGGISIQNLFITGGNGDYAIQSSRPLTNIENVVMEVYDGNGINLFNAGTGGTGGWGSTIRNCRWVAPATATTYRGFNVDTNGGHVTLENCTAIRGQIGINIAQSEAVNIIACSCNGQGLTYASGADADIASIRLSGAGYKKAISIRNCYIEGYVNGIYVEKCESLSVEDNYIADLGYAVGKTGHGIYLKDSNVNNVTIKNNHFAENSTVGNVVVDDGVNNVIIDNNYMNNQKAGGACIVNGTSTSVRYRNNKFQNNISGYTILDPNNTLINQDYALGGFASKQIINTLVLDGVWNDLVNIKNLQVWQVRLTIGSSKDWRSLYEIYIDSTGASAVETVYDVNPGYGATLSVQVSGGKIQYQTSGGNAQITAVATKIV